VSVVHEHGDEPVDRLPVEPATQAAGDPAQPWPWRPGSHSELLP
jgi:hypothetical protein